MLTIEEKAECRTDFLTYCNKMLGVKHGSKAKSNWHQAEMCNVLEKVVAGLIKRLIINIPPRSGKTEFAVILFISWCMGNWPDCEFLHASYSATLAADNAARVRDLMKTPLYEEIFGVVDFRRDTNAKDDFRTARGGRVYAVGAEGTITGIGAGKMRPGFGGAAIVDDPTKAQDRNSEAAKRRAKEFFSGTLESRKNSPHTPIIIIMQRLAVDDMAGWLLDNGNGEEWYLLSIPAITEAGESFWEEQFPLESLLREKKHKAAIFAGQYMQAPYTEGGEIIKSEWLMRYDTIPRGKMKYRAIYIDTANKTGEHNDYTVMQCWGLSTDGRAYLIDQFRDKVTAPQLIQKALDFWAKHAAYEKTWFGALRCMYVEDKQSGTTLIQTIHSRGRIPIKPIVFISDDNSKRKKGKAGAISVQKDKYTRVQDVLEYFSSGLIYIPSDAPWVLDYIGELESFTADDSHEHDDQVDTTVYAINGMMAQKSHWMEMAR